MKIPLFIKKLFGRKHYVRVYEDIETYSFLPSSEITAYELFLYMCQPRSYSREEEIKEWWENKCPNEIKKYYKPMTKRICTEIVEKYKWEMTKNDEKIFS